MISELRKQFYPVYQHGVYEPEPPLPESQFEQHYLKLRTQEGRHLSDALLKQLPDLPAGIAHAQEWKMRLHSFHRAATLLQASFQSGSLLDLGCGNGWMSASFARLTSLEVTGMDVGRTELEQAARVWHDVPRLWFCRDDVFRNALPPESFDAITLGASVQYFPHLDELVKKLKFLLKPSGQIHIFDSPFYPESERQDAANRSKDYYTTAGFPELSACYHHHSREAALQHGEFIYDPTGGMKKLIRKLSGQGSPFPHLVIRK